MLKSELFQVGTKYYRIEDVQSVLDARIESLIPDDA